MFFLVKYVSYTEMLEIRVVDINAISTADLYIASQNTLKKGP
jgi:hypothetical protein